MADALFDKVSLLLHCEEGYQTDSTYDSSLHSRKVDLFGGCAMSATQSKFGGKSLAFLADGHYAASAADVEFNFSNGPATFECWIYPTSTTAFGHVMGQWGSSGSECSWHVGIGPGTSVFFELSDTGGYVPAYSTGVSSGGITLNAWNHIAVVFVPGSSIKLFCNGNLVTTGAAPASLYNSTAQFRLGRISLGQQFYGYIDEVRVTKGAARYSTSFSVPTAAFDPNTPMPAPLYRKVSDTFLSYGDRLPQSPLNAKKVGAYYQWEVQTSGTGRIAGKVTIENIPGSRKVRLFRKHDGMLLRETWSAPNGAYSFSNLDPAWEYFVVAHDHLRVYNGVISDMLNP